MIGTDTKFRSARNERLVHDQLTYVISTLERVQTELLQVERRLKACNTKRSELDACIVTQSVDSIQERIDEFVEIVDASTA